MQSISVVIPCHNAAGTLDECLGAIARSSIPVRECIVVDDASKDDTAEKARGLGARVVSCEERKGPARARNIGAGQATSSIILFLDADVAVHEDAIARIAQLLTDDAVDAVIGAYDDTPAAPSFVSQYRNLLHCFTHRRGRRNASTFWGGCGAIRRGIFLQNGGFCENYTRPAIEDIEFGHRLTAAGGSIILDPSIQVKHLKRWTLFNMVRTDIFDRGIPWSRLILRTRHMPDDLNLRRTQRASMAAAFLALIAACLGHPLVGLLCITLAVLLNQQFYAFLAARRGVWFAFRAIPLHLAYFIYSGVAFAIGAIEQAIGAAE